MLCESLAGGIIFIRIAVFAMWLQYCLNFELARALKLDRSYVARTLSLVNLVPDIIVAVMQGKTPPQMTLAKAVNNLPEDWQEQRELFGFCSK